MSGALFLGVSALVCAGVFLNGLRFARMTRNPWAGRTVFGQPVRGADMSLEQVRRIGLLFMAAAPLFLILAAALAFGLLGPSNITPIKL